MPEHNVSDYVVDDVNFDELHEEDQQPFIDIVNAIKAYQATLEMGSGIETFQVAYSVNFDYKIEVFTSSIESVENLFAALDKAGWSVLSWDITANTQNLVLMTLWV